MKKFILLILLLIISSTILNAKDSYKYASFISGKLDYDKTVYGNKNDALIMLEEEDKLLKYDHAYLMGFDYTWLKQVSQSPLILGVSPKILLNHGEFYKGGFANINFLMGIGNDTFKFYGNYGKGINLLSKYTISTGDNYGLTARFDFSKNFSASASYNFYNFGNEDNNDDYKVEGALFTLGLKF